MVDYKRRRFIKTSAYSTLILASPGILSCADKSGPKDIEPIKEKSVVSLIKGDDLYEMTRNAIDAIGGMSSIINEGDTVFIKPNFVNFPWAEHNNCFLNGECTKPEIIITCIEECLQAGAKEVIVGEGSHLPEFDWKWAITLDGNTDLVEAAISLSDKYSATVTMACLEKDSPAWVEIDSATPHNKIAISSIAAHADKVISLPVAKTHSWSQLTLGCKNFLGITPLSRYAQWVDNSWWNRGSFDHSSPRAIGQVFLDIVQALKPDLTVTDFSIGIEGNGPTMSNGGEPIDVKDQLGSWAMLASKDIMAADATATRMMSHSVSKIKQLQMGYEMGLGNIHLDKIDIIGEKLADMEMSWKAARLLG